MAALLLGQTEGHLGASAILWEVFGREDGDAPAVDLEAEKRHGDFIRANAQWITACTDLSDGGLALAAFEMAAAAGLGVSLDADDTPTLFGEDQGRYLIACNYDTAEWLMVEATKAGVPLQSVGQFGGSDVKMGRVSAPLEELVALWQGSLCRRAGMTERLDLESWPLAEQFRFFRDYDRPHYATTARVDVTALKASGLPVFRSCLWAIGAGLHAVPELRTRFQRRSVVTRYDRIALVADNCRRGWRFSLHLSGLGPGSRAFDAHAEAEIAKIRAGQPLNANSGEMEAVGYLSCLPWLDYSALDNALPGPEDCIPRVSWGQDRAEGRGL